jgi:hypothetical protein
MPAPDLFPAWGTVVVAKQGLIGLHKSAVIGAAMLNVIVI